MQTGDHSSGMSYSEPRFEELTRDMLEGSKDVIFIVDSELCIKYCNPAWDEFALANGGEEVVAARVLGTDLMHVIPESLRDFYSEVFQDCRQRHLTFDLDYECSSAELYRLLHMNILPLKRSGELAFINSTRVERIHGAERPASPPTNTYFSAHGMITACCHCRRTKRQDASDVWDWVPAFLQPAFLQAREWEISHGICPVCLSYFYSQYLTAGHKS